MIQKSELEIVPVEQRIPGRVYGVDNKLEGELDLVVIYKDNKQSVRGVTWEYWFALPESMLPVREVLPDEFELKHSEWDVKTTDGDFSPLYCDFEFRRIKRILNPFCIHMGTKSEQIAEIEKILAELKQS
jgi:hypothetical protein